MTAKFWSVHLRESLCGVLTLSVASLAGAQADPPDSFFRDAKAGFNARSFYMDADDKSKPPATSQKQAWALGGKLHARSGYWEDLLQLGASYYLSAPLYAPEDKDGTGLLAPGQHSISVLGEVFARLKFGETKLTAGRQEIDMAYPRATGVRGNRSDATYVGKQDSRMVPVTYEAVLVDGSVQKTFNYYLGWVNKVKPRNLSEFQSAGQAVGAKDSDADMWYAGLQVSPAKDFWLQGWYHRVPDVINIGWLDGDYVLRLAESGHVRFAGQYTDQRSDGANQLTGKAFSTRNAQGYLEYGAGAWTLYGVYSRTGSGADLRNPFTSGPIYTQQIVRTFVRAHETAWQLGVGADFASWGAAGVTAYADMSKGSGAINASTGGALASTTEYNLGTVWTYRSKGVFIDGLHSRIRWAWVIDNTTAGDQRTTDLRIDINLPIALL